MEALPGPTQRVSLKNLEMNSDCMGGGCPISLRRRGTHWGLSELEQGCELRGDKVGVDNGKGGEQLEIYPSVYILREKGPQEGKS